MRPRISPLIASLLLLLCFGLQFTSADTTDTIRPGQSLNTSGVISSANGRFSLRFDRPFDNLEKRYVFIVINTYNRVVWAANRGHPTVNSSAVLTFNQEGNLVISDGSLSYRVTNASAGNDTYARLLDTGNLILTNNAKEVLWQSFDYPFCVLLPGMKIKDAKTGWSFVSLKCDLASGSANDLAPGSFSLHLGAQKELILMDGSKPYWSSRLVGDLAAIFEIDGEDITWRHNYTNSTSQVALDCRGNLKLLTYDQKFQKLNNDYLSKCAGHICSDFNICNETLSSLCDCLPGFTNGMNGCERRTELQCSNSTKVQKDKFLPISRVALPRNPVRLPGSNTSDCKSACLNNCSCTGYAYDQEDRCLVWSGPLVDLKQRSTNYVYQTDFYLKLATLDNLGETNSTIGIVTVPKYENSKVRENKKIQKVVIPTASIAVLFTMGLFVYHVMIKLRSKGEDLLLLDLGMMQTVNTTEDGHSRKRDVQMPLFSFASVCAATDNFSTTNKLGEGGFGPVYKGRLLKGDEVAIKRLSKRSGQGWVELKNEAMLIAKLQHKNLVKLLGCCIEKDENILIYEYLPNKSLDYFVFDLEKRRTLNWETRVQIIEGIAQGLAYLHQYSRLRIIHRDLKPSNILLDIDMNPKISDFGIARIFGGNELQANTNRIVGTHGYMPPEYILEGLFSIKSDVFSFGILFLEILSGKKSIGYNQTTSFHLLAYAWELWTNDKGANLVDPQIENIPSIYMVLRYVNIALLCVQENAKDRPTMSDVVTMLSYENVAVPYPNEPAFLNVRNMMKTHPVDTATPETCSGNDVTDSIMEGR